MLLARIFVFRRITAKFSAAPKPIRHALTTGGALFCAYSLKNGIRIADCEKKIRTVHANFIEDPWLLVPSNYYQNPIANCQSSLLIKLLCLPFAVLTSTFTFIRLSFRAFSLGLRFLPLLFIYPLASRTTKTKDFWWSAALWVIQGSGPTLIKLGQWLASRRDIFSETFCNKLSILHTNTKRPQLFRECDLALASLFGVDILKYKEVVFPKIHPFSVGSGCIAHVYKVTIDTAALEMFTGLRVEGLSGLVDVAIKIADKGIEKQIETDLRILRGVARFAQTFIPSIWYLDPIGSLNQFEMVLRRQVDLRNEGRALQRFTENFHHGKLRIEFPKVIAFNRRVLCETFEAGDHFDAMLEKKEKSKESAEVRHKIAVLGAQGFLQMAFVDNFIHGDLHPGNILIRFNEKNDQHLPKNPLQKFMDKLRWLLRRNSVDESREPTLVLLDAGIAVSQTPENVQRFKKMFKYIIENRGYEAGQFFLTYEANRQKCRDSDAFCRDLKALVDRARRDSFHRTINVTSVFNEMFSILWKHRVLIDSSFTSVMLSMMVLEGIGRTLDPKLDLFECAKPYLLNVFF